MERRTIKEFKNQSNIEIKSFAKRKYKDNPIEDLDIIRNSEALKERWNKYQKNFEYAEGIEFEEIMEYLEIMIEQFEVVGV